MWHDLQIKKRLHIDAASVRSNAPPFVMVILPYIYLYMHAICDICIIIKREMSRKTGSDAHPLRLNGIQLIWMLVVRGFGTCTYNIYASSNMSMYVAMIPYQVCMVKCIMYIHTRCPCLCLWSYYHIWSTYIWLHALRHRATMVMLTYMSCMFKLPYMSCIFKYAHIWLRVLRQCAAYASTASCVCTKRAPCAAGKGRVTDSEVCHTNVYAKDLW